MNSLPQTERLREAMKEASASLGDLGSALGVSPVAVHNKLSGRAALSTRDAQRMAEIVIAVAAQRLDAALRLLSPDRVPE